MINKGNLSEKDELIKSLRGKENVSPELKRDINKKANALEGNKTLTK